MEKVEAITTLGVFIFFILLFAWIAAQGLGPEVTFIFGGVALLLLASLTLALIIMAIKQK